MSFTCLNQRCLGYSDMIREQQVTVLWSHAAQSALQNDTSQVKHKQQEIPLRLFVKNF